MRLRRTTIALVAAMALVGASCSDDSESADPTTTTAPGTPTSEPGSPSTTKPEPSASWQRCDNPEGFSISYPSSWHVNDGATTTGCSLFDPEPFEVPEATDARVAAISAYVDAVAFHEVAAPGDQEFDRAVTAIDGHQAVRTVAPGGELYGDDVERTAYVVDLALGVDDGPGTLFVDVVEVEGTEYHDAVAVMDRMVRSIDLSVPDDAPSDIVARYEGAAPFSAALRMSDGQPCILTPLTGDTRTECFVAPSSDGLRFNDLSGDLFSAFGGVTGTAVARVDITSGSDTFSYLPVGVPEVDARGFVAPISGDGVTQLTWYAADGSRLGTRQLDQESGPDPVDGFESLPARTDDFPGSDEIALLEDVRLAGHDGFDRIVFEFRGDHVPTYELVAADEVRDTSGSVVAVAGGSIIRVTMSRATGVDLSGDRPNETYEGANRLAAPHTTAVSEIVEVEDFEATLTWAIGVDRDREVAVAVLENPSRLVIDVRATS